MYDDRALRRLALAFLALFVAASVCLAQPAQQTVGRAFVKHVVTMNRWGLLLIEDDITLQQPAPSSLFVGYPKNCSVMLGYVEVFDASGSPLHYFLTSIGNLTGVNVSLPGDVDRISIRAAVYGNITKSWGMFVVTIPLCPSLSVESVVSTVLELPDRVSLASSEPWSLDRVSKRSYVFVSELLEPYTPMWEIVSLECEEPLQPFLCVRQRVDVRVTSRGVRVSETMELQALMDDLSEVEVPIPPLAREVEARDDMGLLDVEVGNSTARISFRLELDYGESYSVTLTYTLPKNSILSKSGSSKTLSTEPIPTPDWLVEKFEVSFNLPPGSRVLSSSPEDYQLHSDIQTGVQVAYSFSDVNPLNRQVVTLTYCRPPYWAVFRPLMWALLAAAALAAAVAVSRLKLPPPPPPAVPRRDIAVLVELYEERVSAEERMEELERRLREGKMTTREYRRRSSALRRRLLELDTRLKSVSRKVRAEYPDLAEAISDIEAAEAEVRAARAAIRSLEMRRRRGEISRTVYNRIRSKYVKRLEKAKKSISKALSRLRAEAG